MVVTLIRPTRVWCAPPPEQNPGHVPGHRQALRHAHRLTEGGGRAGDLILDLDRRRWTGGLRLPAPSTVPALGSAAVAS